MRPRVNDDGFQRFQHALTAVGNMGMATARAMRLLTGLCIITLLVPKDPTLGQFSCIEKVMNDPVIGLVRTWTALVLGMSIHPKVPEQYRSGLSQHVQQISNEQALLGKNL